MGTLAERAESVITADRFFFTSHDAPRTLKYQPDEARGIEEWGEAILANYRRWLCSTSISMVCMAQLS